MLEKPADVAEHPVKSRVWDEVTKGRAFSEADIPTLRLLCTWHAVAEACMDELDDGGETRLTYMNSLKDLKALPQIATLKQASAEIRAINKQLSIKDEAAPQPKETTLSVIQGRRANRQSKAKNTA